MIWDPRFSTVFLCLLTFAFCLVPQYWIDLYLYAPPSRDRVARIVPEFCARGPPEKRLTPDAARNKKFLARGAFSLFNCCTNVVIWPKPVGANQDSPVQTWEAGGSRRASVPARQRTSFNLRDAGTRRKTVEPRRGPRSRREDGRQRTEGRLGSEN
jgi:hypothetical protein